MALIVAILLLGLVVGALGRLLVPGPNPMGIVKTALVGVAGGLIGGLVGNAVFDEPGGLLFAVLGAALIVWWIERGRARRADTG